MYSALLPTCCELEAGMIYTGTQPQTASFNFQGHSDVIQEFLGVPVVLRKIHNLQFHSSYVQQTLQHNTSLCMYKENDIFSGEMEFGICRQCSLSLCQL